MPPPRPVSEPTNPARREAIRTIPVNSAAVNTQYELSADHGRSALTATGTGLLARRLGSGRCTGSTTTCTGHDTLVNQHRDFHAPILLAAFFGLVISRFVTGSHSRRCQDAVNRNVALLLQITNNRVGPVFAEDLIFRRVAGCISEPGNFDDKPL